MSVLADSRRLMRDALDVGELAEQLPVTGEGALDPDEPEAAAALEELIRDYETKWLDEPIPALAGHTPRQAADDPARRSLRPGSFGRHFPGRSVFPRRCASRAEEDVYSGPPKAT